MDEIVAEFPHHFLRASDLWITGVHHFDTWSISKAVDAYRQMTHPEDFALAATYDQYLLKEHILRLLTPADVLPRRFEERGIHVPPGNEYGFDFHLHDDREVQISKFPGPMPVQLSRKLLPMLKSHEYWITEKSDGVRVMMYSLFAPAFPRLKLLYTAPASKDGTAFDHIYSRTLSLKHTLLLLGAVLDTIGSRSFRTRIPVTIWGQEVHIIVTSEQDFQQSGFYVIVNPSESARQNCISDDPSTGIPVEFLPSLADILFDSSVKYALEVADHGFQLESGELVYFVQNGRGGRMLSYVFDRKWDLYLCMDEFPFPFPTRDDIYPVVQQPFLLVDGEIIRHLKTGKLVYSIYDLVACWDDAFRLQLFIDRPISTKIVAVKHGIVESHYRMLRKWHLEMEPQSLTLVAKRFFKSSELSVLMELIDKDPVTGERIFNKYNRSDGLIFTPESPDLYRFAAGTAENLFKWKWPEKLTADFLLERVPYQYVGEGSLVPFDMLYSVGGQDHALYHRTYLSADHPVCHVQSPAVVVECFYDAVDTRQWVPLHIRSDKTTANALRTVTSVLETMSENITVEEVALALGAKSSASAHAYGKIVLYTGQAAFSTLQGQLEKEFSRIPPFMIATLRLSDIQGGSSVNADPDRKIGRLEAWVGEQDRKYEWRMVVDSVSYRQATALCEPMAKALMEGRSYRMVRCVYLTSAGQWFIVSAIGFDNNASVTALFNVLEYYAQYHRRYVPDASIWQNVVRLPIVDNICRMQYGDASERRADDPDL